MGRPAAENSSFGGEGGGGGETCWWGYLQKTGHSPLEICHIAPGQPDQQLYPSSLNIHVCLVCFYPGQHANFKECAFQRLSQTRPPEMQVQTGMLTFILSCT